MWNKKIDTYLKKIGFKACISDPCIYVRCTKDNIAFIGIWVDNLVIIADKRTMTMIKKLLDNEFKMKDLGEVSYILGVAVMRNCKKREVYLSQPLYIERILEKFGMTDCKPCATPADISVKLILPKEGHKVTDEPYREAVRSLMYLMICTRPDIAVAVVKVAQFCEKYDDFFLSYTGASPQFIW